MNRSVSALFACIVLVSGNSAQQISRGNGGFVTASPLVQIEHMAGDRYTGFADSCLLVYSNGEYHREIRRQISHDGRPSGNWQIPEVFEGAINAGDLKQLGQIVESVSFRAILGTVGDINFRNVTFLIGLGGGAVPGSDVEIFNVSVAHSNGSQMFEVVEPLNREQGNSLRSFKSWFAGIEALKEGRIKNAASSACSIKTPSQDRSSPRDDVTILSPTPLRTPGPDYPIEEQSARHPGNVTIHALVNFDGSVTPISVRSGLDPLLDQYAKVAVSHWRFAPARLNGMPITRPIDLNVSFSMTKDQPQ